MRIKILLKIIACNKTFIAIACCICFLHPAVGLAQNANDYFKNAIAEDKAQHYDNVIKNCSLAIQANPASAEAYYLRGKAKFILKDFYGAIEDEQKAAQLQLQNENVYLISAFAKQALKKYKSALADLNRALSINPENNIAYYHRGFVNARLNNRQQSRTDFGRAIELGLGEPADILTEIEPD
ncbi:MAG: tetratricopeptide repeat protein [Chitinophagaceae bacterium]